MTINYNTMITLFVCSDCNDRILNTIHVFTHDDYNRMLTCGILLNSLKDEIKIKKGLDVNHFTCISKI